MTLLAGAAGPARAQTAAPPGRVAVALLSIENAGSFGQDPETYSALRLGLTATLAAELSRSPGIAILPRGTVAPLLDQQRAGGGRIDAPSAARLGRAAGARWVVTGSFIEVYGKFRLTVRLVDVDRGRIARVVTNADPRTQELGQFATITRDLAQALLAAAGAPAADGTDEPAVSFPAMRAYSLGLLYESRDDRPRAAQHFRRALDLEPGFTRARAGLVRVATS